MKWGIIRKLERCWRRLDHVTNNRGLWVKLMQKIRRNFCLNQLEKAARFFSVSVWISSRQWRNYRSRKSIEWMQNYNTSTLIYSLEILQLHGTTIKEHQVEIEVLYSDKARNMIRGHLKSFSLSIWQVSNAGCKHSFNRKATTSNERSTYTEWNK